MVENTLLPMIDSVMKAVVALRDDTKQAGAEAFLYDRLSDFERFKRLLHSIDDLVPRINGLKQALDGSPNQMSKDEFDDSDNVLPTLKSDLRTPFLEVLRSLGGQAKLSAVMDGVHDRMSTNLTHADYLLDTPSDPQRPRWKSTIYNLTDDLKAEGRIHTVARGVYKLGTKR